VSDSAGNLVIDLNVFSLTGTGTCTPTYSLSTTCNAGPIDTTIFTYSVSANTLTVSTSSTAAIGTYAFEIEGDLDSANFAYTPFNVYIRSHCYG
jgi:hypothetical protein